ncbi:MAG TPA: hypothetical protein VNH21_12405 [Steroidobacteraceae bacterium]|nr:hypothetical protein [Steroidobacteraceae bacterium]
MPPTLTVTFPPDGPIRIELDAPLPDELIDPARLLFATWRKQWRAMVTPAPPPTDITRTSTF